MKKFIWMLLIAVLITDLVYFVRSKDVSHETGRQVDSVNPKADPDLFYPCTDGKCA